jgi:hypothetical protein
MVAIAIARLPEQLQIQMIPQVKAAPAAVLELERAPTRSRPDPAPSGFKSNVNSEMRAPTRRPK